MAETILPGYRYDEKTGRYISQKTGRPVSKRDMLLLLAALLLLFRERLGALTMAFHEGAIAQAVWLEQMRQEITTAHLTNRALGAGGWDGMTIADNTAVRERVQDDSRRLGDFAVAIVAGLTLAQALARAGMYAGTARVQFWDAQRERQAPGDGMMLIEKRTLGASEHCPDCLEYHAQGWQRAGVLPSPGTQSVCLANCQCVIESKEVPALIAGEWIGTRR
ncbi:MAG: hypothetical protein KF753_05050 [Caldilineaceae bacterium]|nr:hypothetical protein [Caldilineaceae bacterium]